MGRKKQYTESDLNLSAGLFKQSVEQIYNLLRKSKDSRVKDCFQKWYEYFRCFDGNLYSPQESQSDFAQYYFSLQTLIAVILKILIAEVFTARGDVQSLSSIFSEQRTERDIFSAYGRLESPEFFNNLGLVNYLEDDFYGWLSYAEPPDTGKSISNIAQRIFSFASQTSNGSSALDLVQALYQDSIPRSVRHYLGEYYTPDWLAGHIHDRVIVGKRKNYTVIDPSCGSGIFLLTAIDRMKKMPDVESLLSRFRGYDINPLAVLSARTNLGVYLARKYSSFDSLSFPIQMANSLTEDSIAPADFILGNPPWIFWNTLPSPYRESLLDPMRGYGLIAEKQSSMKRLGSSGKDVSMLFFYKAIDKFLKPSGKLGFVITQSVFQSTAADEFRKFTLPDGAGIKIDLVEDWRSENPFRLKTRNKTAVVYASKGQETTYPVCYEKMSLINGNVSGEKNFAHPSNLKKSESFWVITRSKKTITGITGQAPYQPRLGIETKLESVFRVTPSQGTSENTVSVVNDRRRARIHVPEHTALIEPDRIFPYVSGASLYRWGYTPAGYYIVPHTAETGINAIDSSKMTSRYPLTLKYFNRFKEELLNRSLHRRWGKRQPFYSMYGIGPYTFTSYRVAWKRTTRDFAAAVLTTYSSPFLGEKQILANGKVMIIPFEDKLEAHFVCAVLNAPRYRERINNSITSEAHRDIINVIPWRRYDKQNTSHQTLADLSLNLHQIDPDNSVDIDRFELELDAILQKEWSA